MKRHHCKYRTKAFHLADMNSQIKKELNDAHASVGSWQKACNDARTSLQQEREDWRHERGKLGVQAQSWRNVAMTISDELLAARVEIQTLRMQAHGVPQPANDAKQAMSPTGDWHEYKDRG